MHTLEEKLKVAMITARKFLIFKVVKGNQIFCQRSACPGRSRCLFAFSFSQRARIGQIDIYVCKC